MPTMEAPADRADWPRCWKCRQRFAKVTTGPDAGKLRYEVREIAPGQTVKMHVVCSETFDGEVRRAAVTADLPPWGEGLAPAVRYDDD